MASKYSSILWFLEVDKDDIGIVGGKGANLGEMSQAGFPIPDGFIVTSHAYYQFILENKLAQKIKDLLSTTHYERPDSLMQVSQLIKRLIMQAEVSPTLIKEIDSAYSHLGGMFKNALVAVRSSSTTEDSPTASFAGQQKTFLNVHGESNLILNIRECWASLFEPRAIFYRHAQKFDHFRIGCAIVVQKMIESEKSGIMFTIDPLTNDKSKIVVEAIYGLGELISQGQLTPDHYEISKNDMTITNKIIAYQNKMLKKGGGTNKEISILYSEGLRQKITDNQIINLALLGKKLETHYYFPQDIEWAIEKNKIYIVQTRAITTTHKRLKAEKELLPSEKLPLLIIGAPVSRGIASGPVKIIHKASELGKVLPGDILVSSQTDPDFVPAMKKAAAIVTDKGGETSHAAIVSRELGIPAVVGTEKATKVLKNGLIVTVNGTNGHVYKGSLKHTSRTHLPSSHHHAVKTATKVYVSLANPANAEKLAQENVDGVGLFQADTLIGDIGMHPKRLIHDGKKSLFTGKLAEQLEAVCKIFDPRPVIYCFSDLKTDEYSRLKNGQEFEHEETNPILGFRGAYRSIHNADVFALELEALKMVRDKKGLHNISVMLPFVRTVNELIEIKRIMAQVSLHRSPTFKLWMMVETPANVILLDKFIEAGIDGISINTDTLTTLLLGTDRDNSTVAKEFDELNPAVLWAIEHAIQIASKHHILTSISGLAPSLYPSLLEKLVTWGITSVSVNPDAIDKVRKNIYLFERKLIEKKTLLKS